MKACLVGVILLLVVLGATVFNSVRPFIFGLPLFMAYNIATVLAMSLIMLVIYRIDARSRSGRRGL